MGFHRGAILQKLGHNVANLSQADLEHRRILPHLDVDFLSVIFDVYSRELHQIVVVLRRWNPHAVRVISSDEETPDLKPALRLVVSDKAPRLRHFPICASKRPINPLGLERVVISDDSGSPLLHGRLYTMLGAGTELREMAVQLNIRGSDEGKGLVILVRVALATPIAGHLGISSDPKLVCLENAGSSGYCPKSPLATIFAVKDNVVATRIERPLEDAPRLDRGRKVNEMLVL